MKELIDKVLNLIQLATSDKVKETSLVSVSLVAVFVILITEAGLLHSLAAITLVLSLYLLKLKLKTDK